MYCSNPTGDHKLRRTMVGKAKTPRTDCYPVHSRSVIHIRRKHGWRVIFFVIGFRVHYLPESITEASSATSITP